MRVFLRYFKAEMKRRIDVGRRDQLHPLQRLEPALCLAGFGGLGTETIHITANVGDLALLLCECGLLTGKALRADQLEGAVVAGVERDPLLFDVHDVAGYRVQKVTIVGDQEQCSGVALEPLFKPDDRVQIQVIGGFVQQQQVGAAHQRARQVETHTPSAGELCHWQCLFAGAKTQSMNQPRRPGAGAVTVDAVQSAVQLRGFRTLSGMLRLGEQ